MDVVTLIVVGLVIVTALVFDFTNGFHDTANAMATSIATGALKPKVAVAAAGTLNLVGAFLSTEVASTISGGIINEAEVAIGAEFIFAGLVGAIVWNLLTWLVGLPSSSSHALLGGLVGAVIVGAGVQGVTSAPCSPRCSSRPSCRRSSPAWRPLWHAGSYSSSSIS